MSQKVIELLQAAFEISAIQEKLHAATTPEQFVKIVGELGYKLTPDEYGMRVVNYTQWRSREDDEAFAKQSSSQGSKPKIFQEIVPYTHIFELHQQTLGSSLTS